MLPFSPSPRLRVSVSPRLFLFFAVWPGLVPQPSVAASTATRPVIQSVRVGFDGHYRVGFWTPVDVAIRGGDQAVRARLILAAPDGDGVRTEFTTNSFAIDAHAERRVTAYVKFGRPESHLSVALVGEAGEYASRSFDAGGKDRDAVFHAAYPSTQALVLALGNPMGLEAAIGGPSGTADRTNVVHPGHAGELPDEAIGYEGVESLVISSSAPGIDEALAIGSSRLAALEEWIEQGGRLVLAVGDDAPRLLAPNAPLGRLLPGQIGEASKLARMTAIEAFGGATLPRAAARGRQDEVVAVRLLDPAGHIELSDGSFPLVVR